MTLQPSPLFAGLQNALQVVRRSRRAWVAVGLSLALAGTAHAQGYANITFGGAFAPGVYGQISLGNNSAPPVWNTQPVIIGRPTYNAPVIYLHVPQEQTRDWGRYCGRYHACGNPVHFVRVEQHNRWWEHQYTYPPIPTYYYRSADEYRDHRHNEWRQVHRDDWRHDRHHNEWRPDHRGEWFYDPRDDRRENRQTERHSDRRIERQREARADLQQERYNWATQPQHESRRGER